MMPTQTEFPEPNGFDVAKGDQGFFTVTYEQIDSPSFLVSKDRILFQPVAGQQYFNVPMDIILPLFQRLDEIPVISCWEGTGKIQEVATAPIHHAQ